MVNWLFPPLWLCFMCSSFCTGVAKYLKEAMSSTQFLGMAAFYSLAAPMQEMGYIWRSHGFENVLGKQKAASLCEIPTYVERHFCNFS